MKISMDLVYLAVSAATLLLAVASPVISNLLNNRHEEKMFRLRYYEQHRAEVIENYIRAAGAAIRFGSNENMEEFGKACGEIYLYAPKNLWPEIQGVNDALAKPDYAAAQKCLDWLCQELSKCNPRLEQKKSDN